jgi:hypothetical protein
LIRCAGLNAEVVAWQWIPFGPVLMSRAEWLEEIGRLDPGRREEELLVIMADKYERFRSSPGAGNTQRPGDGARSGAHQAAQKGSV